MSKRTLIHTNTKQSFSITWADGCEVGCTRSRFTMPLLVQSLTQHKLSFCGRRSVWLTRTERVFRQWVLLWANGSAHCVKYLKGTRMRCTPPQTSISGSYAACRRSQRKSASILKIRVTREQVCWLRWKLEAGHGCLFYGYNPQPAEFSLFKLYHLFTSGYSKVSYRKKTTVISFYFLRNLELSKKSTWNNSWKAAEF